MSDSPFERASVRGRKQGLEVILVAYGSPHLVRSAVSPLAGVYPITVVDNSSLTEIKAVANELGAQYVDPSRNGGFAAGVNYGLRHRMLEGADVLLLNPDAVIGPEDVHELHRALRADPRLASVGPAQEDGNGADARVGWPYPSPGRAWAAAFGLGFIRPAEDFVIGSVLLLRAAALKDVGGFDEQFFLYSEETDWAYRAHRLGWRHAVVRSARAVHIGGATSADWRRRDTQFFASQERYFRKHFGALGWNVARAGAIVGGVVRSLLLPRGPRGRAARLRARLYIVGPVRAEFRLRGLDD